MTYRLAPMATSALVASTHDAGRWRASMAERDDGAKTVTHEHRDSTRPVVHRAVSGWLSQAVDK